MMLKLTSEDNCAIILFEEDGFGRHLEDLGINRTGIYFLQSRTVINVDSTNPNCMKKCRDPPNDIAFFNSGWGIPALK
jgi:hypothetical protein